MIFFIPDPKVYKIEYTMSCKGGILLNVEDYQYMKYRVMPDRIYWACNQRKGLG